MEVELDYEDAIELWKAGDPESARDALRYVLSASRDNLWVHSALGGIALESRDFALARGHYGYAFELGIRAIPRGFQSRLPRDRAANRPFYEALEGLAKSLDGLGKSQDAQALRAEGRSLETGTPRAGSDPGASPDAGPV